MHYVNKIAERQMRKAEMTRKIVVYSAPIVTFFAFLTYPLLSEGQADLQLSQGWNLVGYGCMERFGIPDHI
jgi:hypothetical protein